MRAVHKTHMLQGVQSLLQYRFVGAVDSVGSTWLNNLVELASVIGSLVYCSNRWFDESHWLRVIPAENLNLKALSPVTFMLATS